MNTPEENQARLAESRKRENEELRAWRVAHGLNPYTGDPNERDAIVASILAPTPKERKAILREADRQLRRLTRKVSPRMARADFGARGSVMKIKDKSRGRNRRERRGA